MEPTATKHIESKSGVCGGKPCVSGTRIRVQDIYVWHELQGQCPDEIVTRFPQLTHAGVYAAMAYYWDHRDEIHQQMEAADELLQRMKQQYPSKLQSKLAGTDATDDSISP